MQSLTFPLEGEGIFGCARMRACVSCSLRQDEREGAEEQEAVRLKAGGWVMGGLAGDGEAEAEGVEDAEEGVDAGVALAGEGAI